MYPPFLGLSTANVPNRTQTQTQTHRSVIVHCLTQVNNNEVILLLYQRLKPTHSPQHELFEARPAEFVTKNVYNFFYNYMSNSHLNTTGTAIVSRRSFICLSAHLHLEKKKYENSMG